MDNRKFDLISDSPMILGECPLWDPELSVLYWIDITACEVHSFDITNQAFTVWPLPSEPGCICLRKSGGLIVAMRSYIAILNTDTGALHKIVDAPYDPNKFRFNDGRCDSRGRFWTGTLIDSRLTPTGRLFSLDHGKLREYDCPVTVSNGIAFSPDSSTLYHADTAAHKILRYRFDVITGNLSSPQTFKEFSQTKNNIYLGRPDGATVDSEGAYWVAMYEGGCILRLSPYGDVLDKILVPMMCPTMVAFGGPDLKTLFITSASQKRSNDELVKFPFSGYVISTQVEVVGIQEYAYQD